MFVIDENWNSASANRRCVLKKGETLGISQGMFTMELGERTNVYHVEQTLVSWDGDPET